MSNKRKVSVVVLGNEESVKKALITIILCKELQRATNVLKKTEIYENDTYQVMCVSGHATRDDVRELYAINQQPDMSLLVVKEGFEPGEVWKQIEELNRITGKPTEHFVVVLPLSCTQPDIYMFKSCTLDGLFSELRRLAEERRLMPTNMSYPEHPELTSQSPMETADGGYKKYKNERCAHRKKNLKTGHEAPTRVNLVLLGMAGTGKSASGNTILGKTFFTSRPSSDLITRECLAADAVICGRRVRVIDTPDIFSDDIPSHIKFKHVRRCREFCEQRPCVYLLVMHVSRFTDGEKDILTKLATAFGPKVHEQTVILFTRERDLRQGDLSREEFLRTCNRNLKKIVEKCGNRCVLFENRDPRAAQVDRLMQAVDEVLK